MGPKYVNFSFKNFSFLMEFPKISPTTLTVLFDLIPVSNKFTLFYQKINIHFLVFS